jgi:ferrochelatase
LARVIGFADGVGRVDVVCPGFVADCLETLEEIAMEGRDTFLEAGGREYRYIPCLNDSPEFASALARLVESHTAGWPGAAVAGPTVASTGQLAERACRARALGAQR